MSCHVNTRVHNPHKSSGNDSSPRMVKRKIIQDVSREIPIYPDPTYRPPPKPVKLPLPKVPRCLSDFDPEINMDFEENLSFQEGVISETYQRQDKSYFQEPQELDSLINTDRLVQKYLLKQADIDKILKTMQRKGLKGMHLPVTVNEIWEGYLISPYFKDFYLYWVQNKLPGTKTTLCKVEMLAEKYILLDFLLFKLVTTLEKEMALLVIPEICTAKIIMLYHSSLFTGQQGAIKTYWL